MSESNENHWDPSYVSSLIGRRTSDGSIQLQKHVSGEETAEDRDPIVPRRRVEVDDSRNEDALGTRVPSFDVCALDDVFMGRRIR